jgi:hypothetical protein
VRLKAGRVRADSLPQMLRRTLVLAAALGALAAPPGAQASELIDRNASRVELAVNAKGQALLTYRARGRAWRVLAWGAVNAVAPTPGGRQVEFRLDYSGGWGTYRRKVWQGFRNACAPYDGPELKWFVAGCKAPDGSYWAVQAWQRMLPNYGLAPTPEQAAWELRLSHWRGELPQLQVKLNWAYRTFDHIFGKFTYQGTPVYGFRATPTGNPLDTFGRNLYVDTFNSAYGPGWKRENSFLMHKGSGAFCYGFYPHGTHPAGAGERYRATIIGPGVTPDAYWESSAPGAYVRELDAVMNEEIRALGSSQCKPN